MLKFVLCCHSGLQAGTGMTFPDIMTQSLSRGMTGWWAFVALTIITLFTQGHPYTEKTVTYLQNEKLVLQATLYLPDTGSNHPALMLIHEGGFNSGDRYCFAQYGKYYTRKGYAVLSIDYRLVHQGGAYPNALKDCIEALRWLKADALKYGIDKQRIALIGSSSGAYLAVMTALAEGLADEIKNGHGNFPKETIGVTGVVSSFGLYDWEQCQWKGGGFIKGIEEKSASPTHYCQYANAEFLILAGGRDRLFPPEQARQFVNKLKAQGKKASILIKPGQDHGGICEINGEIAKWAVPIIDNFLKNIFTIAD